MQPSFVAFFRKLWKGKHNLKFSRSYYFKYFNSEYLKYTQTFEYSQTFLHYMKNVRIRSFSGRIYSLSLYIQSERGENTDQKSSEYRHFSCSFRQTSIRLLDRTFLNHAFSKIF